MKFTITRRLVFPSKSLALLQSKARNKCTQSFEFNYWLSRVAWFKIGGWICSVNTTSFQQQLTTTALRKQSTTDEYPTPANLNGYKNLNHIENLRWYLGFIPKKKKKIILPWLLWALMNSQNDDCPCPYTCYTFSKELFSFSIHKL